MTEGASRWVALGPDGLVPCPWRVQKTDLRRCLACGRLIDLDRSAERWAVRCMGGPDRPGPRRGPGGRGGAERDELAE